MSVTIMRENTMIIWTHPSTARITLPFIWPDKAAHLGGQSQAPARPGQEFKIRAAQLCGKIGGNTPQNKLNIYKKKLLVYSTFETNRARSCLSVDETTV